MMVYCSLIIGYGKGAIFTLACHWANRYIECANHTLEFVNVYIIDYLTSKGLIFRVGNCISKMPPPMTCAFWSFAIEDWTNIDYWAIRTSHYSISVIGNLIVGTCTRNWNSVLQLWQVKAVKTKQTNYCC